MRNIVFISCVSEKLKERAKAKNIYTSNLFKKNLAYSKLLNPDETYILSAKHGILKLDDEIEPYNVTLNDMKIKEKKEWASRVLNQLTNLEDIKNSNFIFLAGENYRKYLIPHLNKFEIPMKGLKIGRQLQFLKGKLNDSLV
jgi:cytoplasmic iron level regulating protein YaaA (DUF328/UPF0246 family)